MNTTPTLTIETEKPSLISSGREAEILGYDQVAFPDEENDQDDYQELQAFLRCAYGTTDDPAELGLSELRKGLSTRTANALYYRLKILSREQALAAFQAGKLKPIRGNIMDGKVIRKLPSGSDCQSRRKKSNGAVILYDPAFKPQAFTSTWKATVLVLRSVRPEPL